MGWDGMGWDGMGWDGWMDGLLKSCLALNFQDVVYIRFNLMSMDATTVFIRPVTLFGASSHSGYGPHSLQDYLHCMFTA